MDLSKLDTSRLADEGVKLHLLHPTTKQPLYADEKTEKKPMTITVLGADGERYSDLRREIIDERIAKVQDQRKPERMDSSTIENAAIEHLVSITVGFDNLVLDGKPLEYSKANTRLLFKRLRWVREQVEAFSGNRANFLPA
jgi:hypothetical protein